MNHHDFLPAIKPFYPDIRSCEAWLAQAPLGNSPQACAAFLGFLDQMEDAPPPRGVFLQILERIRPHLMGAIAEHTRKFAVKALPLGAAETMAFKQVSELWLALMRSYRRLLRAALKSQAPDDGSQTQLLLSARSLSCASELICAHLLARREIGSDLWQWLHVSFAFAEARGLANISLGALHPGHSCATLYAQALLYALAEPQSLTQREALWTRVWVWRFAHKLQLVRTSPASHAYAVDLGGGAAPTWRSTAEAPSGHEAPLRFLDMQALGQSLRKRLRRLEAGDNPAELGLGQSCTQPGAGSLLRNLLRAWCGSPATRQFPRRAVSGSAAMVQAAVGFSSAHAVFGGARYFANEIRSWDYSRRDTEHLAIFQRSRESNALQQAAGAERAENWLSLDESAQGFRLRRQAPGARLSHRQLIAVKPSGAPQFILGEVRWLLQAADESLTVGVLVLPGLARACAIRPSSDDPAKPQVFSEAFLLQPMAKAANVSLVLPAGCYQRDRLMEVQFDDELMRVRLISLLERGCDHDRADFVAVTEKP